MKKTHLLAITALGIASWCLVIIAGNVIVGAFH